MYAIFQYIGILMGIAGHAINFAVAWELSGYPDSSRIRPMASAFFSFMAAIISLGGVVTSIVAFRKGKNLWLMSIGIVLNLLVAPAGIFLVKRVISMRHLELLP